jgi:hypothetical protein
LIEAARRRAINDGARQCIGREGRSSPRNMLRGN